MSQQNKLKPIEIPITQPESYEENVYFICPKCNTFITDVYDGNFVDSCPYCGQEIDFSEV